jgi:hypothetical protein
MKTVGIIMLLPIILAPFGVFWDNWEVALRVVGITLLALAWAVYAVYLITKG